jgi:hypothetical protein
MKAQLKSHAVEARRIKGILPLYQHGLIVAYQQCGIGSYLRGEGCEILVVLCCRRRAAALKGTRP